MLKLHTLRLDGFLSYDRAEITLDDEGITFIQGETGAGKSSIFEAILYLLYGKTLRKRATVNDLENKVLSRGYNISLDFQVDDTLYTVKEVRNKKAGNGLFLYENGVDRRAKTDTLTRSKIKQIIDLSEEEFKNLVFLGQRQSQKFIDGTSGERAQLLTELFNLEKYDTFIDKADKLLKTDSFDKDQLIAFAEDLKVNIEDLKKNIKKQQKLDQVDPQVSKDLEDEINRLSDELRHFRYEEMKVREELARVEISQKNIKKLETLSIQIDELNDKLSQYPALKYSHKDLISLREKGKAKKGILSKSLLTKERELGELGSIGDICPISNKECSLKIPTKYKTEREADINAALQKLSEEFDEIDTKLSKICNLLEKAETIDALKRELEQKTSTFQSMQESIGDVHTSDMTKLIQNSAFFSQKIEIAEQKIKEKNRLFNDLKTKKCLFEQQESYRESLETMLKEKQAQLVEKQKKMAKIANRSQYLAVAVKVFKKLKLYKLDLILDRINVNIQAQLSNISDSLKVKFSSFRAGSKGKALDSLNISVVNGAIELPLEMLSGGQTTQLGLAILLGMYKTVFELSEKSVNMLFLDEAFGTLSDDIIDGTFESIVDLTKSLGFNNVKIISHRQLDSRKFDHVWQINRVNGVSSLTVVN